MTNPKRSEHPPPPCTLREAHAEIGAAQLCRGKLENWIICAIGRRSASEKFSTSGRPACIRAPGYRPSSSTRSGKKRRTAHARLENLWRTGAENHPPRTRPCRAQGALFVRICQAALPGGRHSRVLAAGSCAPEKFARNEPQTGEEMDANHAGTTGAVSIAKRSAMPGAPGAWRGPPRREIITARAAGRTRPPTTVSSTATSTSISPGSCRVAGDTRTQHVLARA